MEFSNQFKESFKHGLIAGYCFTATFVIVFYMFYCLPAQVIKNRKNKKVGHMKTEEKHKLPCQKFKQQKINKVLSIFLLHIPFITKYVFIVFLVHTSFTARNFGFS